VAHLLQFKKNTVQRIFQLKHWQVRKRPVGFRPRVQALPSVAAAPNERWATDLCRVWTGRDGWAVLALVIDCCSRELLGWHLSRSGKSKTAESALEQALIARFGTLGRVPAPFLLRSDNGWSSPVAATPPWCATMDFARSSSRRTRQNRMAWWNA
jgi:putative transposase